VALEVSRFAADPLLLFHLSNSRHQMTPSMGFWLLLSIALHRDFYAEQRTTSFADDVLGVRAIPSLLTRAVHVIHDALPPYTPLMQPTGTSIIFPIFPQGGGPMLSPNLPPGSGTALTAQAKRKRPINSTKPQFKIPIGPQHRLWRTSITADGLCLFRSIDTFKSSSLKGPKYYQNQLLKFMEDPAHKTRILAAVNEFRRKTSDDPQAEIQYSDDDFEELRHSIQHCDPGDPDQELPFVEAIAVAAICFNLNIFLMQSGGFVHVSGGQIVQGAPMGVLHIKHNEQHLKWLSLVEPQPDHYNVLSTADPRFSRPPFTFDVAAMRDFLIPAVTASSLPDWDRLIEVTASGALPGHSTILSKRDQLSLVTLCRMEQAAPSWRWA